MCYPRNTYTMHMSYKELLECETYANSFDDHDWITHFNEKAREIWRNWPINKTAFSSTD